MFDFSQVHKPLSVAATDATGSFHTWRKEIDLFCRALHRSRTMTWKREAEPKPLSRFGIGLVAADPGTHAVR